MYRVHDPPSLVGYVENSLTATTLYGAILDFCLLHPMSDLAELVDCMVLHGAGCTSSLVDSEVHGPKQSEIRVPLWLTVVF